MGADIWCIFILPLSIVMILFILYLLAMPDKMDKTEVEDIEIKNESKVYQDAINTILINSIASIEEKQALDIKLAELNGSKLPIKVKLVRALTGLTKDKYARVSALQLTLSIIGTFVITVLIGILLENIAVIISCIVISIALPALYFKIRSLLMQYHILKDNAYLLEVHNMNMQSSRNVNESFYKTIDLMESNPRNMSCLKAYIDARVAKKYSVIDSLDIFFDSLDGDVCVRKYIDILKKISKEGDNNKPMLKTQVEQLHSIVKQNKPYMNFLLWGFGIYIGAYIISYIILFYYKITQPDFYLKIISTFIGQGSMVVIFVSFSFILLPIFKHCKIITLNDLAQTDEEDDNDVRY